MICSFGSRLTLLRLFTGWLFGCLRLRLFVRLVYLWLRLRFTFAVYRIAFVRALPRSRLDLVVLCRCSLRIYGADLPTHVGCVCSSRLFTVITHTVYGLPRLPRSALLPHRLRVWLICSAFVVAHTPRCGYYPVLPVGLILTVLTVWLRLVTFACLRRLPLVYLPILPDFAVTALPVTHTFAALVTHVYDLGYTRVYVYVCSRYVLQHLVLRLPHSRSYFVAVYTCYVPTRTVTRCCYCRFNAVAPLRSHTFWLV